MSRKGKILLLRALVVVAFGGCCAIAWQYHQVGGDFEHEYLAGKAFLAGNPVYGEIKNPHPPLTVLYGALFAALNANHAFLAHGLLSLLSLFGILFLTARLLRLSDIQALILFGAGPILYSSLSNFALGTLSLQVGFLTLFAFYLSEVKSPLAAGVSLGLATLLKLYPFGFITFFIIRREWQTFFSCLLVCLVGFTLMCYLLGTSQVLQFFLVESPRNFAEYRYFPDNLSLYGFVGKLFYGLDSSPPLLMTLAENTRSCLYVLLSASIFWSLVFGTAKLAKNNSVLAFSFFSAGWFLIIPLCWGHYLTPLILPVVYLLTQPATRTTLYLTLLSVVVFDLTHWLTHPPGPGFFSLGTKALLAFPTLILLILFLRLKTAPEPTVIIGK